MCQFLLLLPFLLLVFAATSNVCAQASDDKDKTEQEVRTLNTEEVDGFLHNDLSVMERLWSDDLVVTNPLNKFVNKQQVLGMMRSGFLIITAYDRQIEYLRQYGDTVIVAGPETVR